MITLLLALDAQVHLYDNGWMGLKDFIALSRKTRDLLTEVKVRRRTASVYHAFRLTATDLPLINCGISRTGDGQLRIALGARPAIADVVVCTDPLADAVKEGHLDLAENTSPCRQTIHTWAKELAAEFTYGTNLRASATYRKHIAAVILEQCLVRLYKLLNAKAVGNSR